MNHYYNCFEKMKKMNIQYCLELLGLLGTFKSFLKKRNFFENFSAKI